MSASLVLGSIMKIKTTWLSLLFGGLLMACNLTNISDRNQKYQEAASNSCGYKTRCLAQSAADEAECKRTVGNLLLASTLDQSCNAYVDAQLAYATCLKSAACPTTEVPVPCQAEQNAADAAKPGCNTANQAASSALISP